MTRRTAVTLVAALAISAVPAAADEQDRDASLSSWISDTAAVNREPIEFDGHAFSGPGWERLLKEGRKAGFFLVGEEHGIAENPMLAAQLFVALTDSGYNTFTIEVSPAMAAVMDAALAENGLDGLRHLFAQAGGEPAFFGMAEEAEMLAAVRAALPGNQQVLWGADYEVAGDRTLLREFAATPKPAVADVALDALIEAANEGWGKHAETGSPEYIFTFAGDPDLVRAVEYAWPTRDGKSGWILDTLEETLEINQLWARGHSWESNRRRANLLRSNFIRQWRESRAAGESRRVMAKFGANHLVRGRNMTQTFDLGSLQPELAALNGSRSFSVMVVPGKGSSTAVLNASTWRYEPSSPKDGYDNGLQAITGAAFPNTFTLIDLVPLRPIVASKTREVDDRLLRVVFGYDMLLVMSGSTAAMQFELE